MQNKTVIIPRLLCVCLTCFSIIHAHAQTEISDPIFNYYTDTELYQNGYKAYQENDFTAAALYLYAYAQRHEEILNGSGSQEKAEFYSALVYTTRHLHAVVHQKTDDPYGRAYMPLDKSYFANKPQLPKSLTLQDESEKTKGKNVKFKVFVKRDKGDAAATGEAVVVRYDVSLHPSGNSFKVTDIHTEFTKNGGKSPAVFEFRPGEMAYFEVYRSLAEVKAVSKGKIAQKWTEPPFKNFGKDSTRLCKTNYFDADNPLKNACYTNLTLGYNKTETASDKDTPQPIALFEAEPTAFIAPCSIRFINRSQNAERFVWKINDKIISTEKDLVYTFNTSNGYRIKLIVWNGDKSDEYEKTISIRGE